MNSPNPIRVIENQIHTFVDISDSVSSHDKLSPCVWEESPREKDPYRGYLIQNCHHCTIVIRMKIIQLTLVDCSNCSLHVYAPLIHSVDAIRCSFIKGSHLYTIPVIHWDHCDDITWNQYMDSTIYRLTYTPEICVCLHTQRDQTYRLQPSWLEPESWFSVNSADGCIRYDTKAQYASQTELMITDWNDDDLNLEI